MIYFDVSPSEVSTRVGLPPPLRERVGERGKPLALTEKIQRRSINAILAKRDVAMRLPIAQAARLSPTLSRKGGGSPTTGTSLTCAAVGSRVESGSPQ